MKTFSDFIAAATLLILMGFFSSAVASDPVSGSTSYPEGFRNADADSNKTGRVNSSIANPAPRSKNIENQPVRIDNALLGHESSSSISPDQGCELLNYQCNATYAWPSPNDFGDDLFAMRFTLAGPDPCTLMAIEIALYEPESVNLSGQGIMVYILDDDGSGLPGTVLDAVRVWGDAIVWYPSTTVVAPNSPIVLPPEFHVAYSVIDPEQDVFAILSDDGTCGSVRSSAMNTGIWHSISDLYDLDVNFALSAEVCCGGNAIPYITNHPDTLRQSYCSYLYYDYFGEDPDGDEIRFDFLSGPGTMDTATGEWNYQPSDADVGEHQLSYQVCDATGCSEIMYTTVIIENYQPLPQSSCDTTIEGVAGDRIQYTINAIGPERCDDLTYSMVSGPGEIDASTGVYSWDTGPDDTGSYDISVGITDGFWDFVPCGFVVDVADSGTCGDANNDGGINIGDAVYLINYIFKGGPPPNPLSAGDVNSDNDINVGDAVYIISYVFKGGPAPCTLGAPCCNAPPCAPNPPVPVTYTEIPSPTPNCGGDFGLWEGWTMTATYSACCVDGDTWQMRVTTVNRPYSISVCAQGRKDVNGGNDVADAAECKKAVADLEFVGNPAPGRPAKNDYTSTSCTEVHESTHQAESKAAIDAAWVAGEAAIEALTTLCIVPGVDTPAEAAAVMKAAADAILRNTQAAAWANTPGHGPPDTSGAYAAQKGCHDGLIATLKAAYPGC